MTIDVLERAWPFLAALGFLGIVTFLRILAIYRHHEIAPYDLAREANRVRREYLQQKKQDN